MGINKREEGKKVNSNINVTPMVDVMLVLLIIFMVITPMLQNKVNVDLPMANAAIIMENANKEDAVHGRGHPRRQDLPWRRPGECRRPGREDRAKLENKPRARSKSTCAQTSARTTAR